MRTVKETGRSIECGHRGERTDEDPATPEYWDREMTPLYLIFACSAVRIELSLYSDFATCFVNLLYCNCSYYVLLPALIAQRVSSQISAIWEDLDPR